MNRLLQIREVVKAFYEKYSRFIVPVGRFLLSLILYLTIFYHTGYNVRFTKPIFAVGLALITAFLPMTGVPVIMCLLVLAEFLSLSLEVTVVTMLLLTLMLLLYFVFRPGKSFLMALAVLFCLWKIPLALLPAALLISPIEALTVAFGILIYGLVAVVKKDVALFSSSSTLTMTGKINQLLSDLFSSEKLMLILLSVTMAMILISMIKKQKMNHAHLVGMISGDLLYLMIVVIGDLLIGIEINLPNLLAGLAVNILMSLIIVYLFINMDYRHTEIVEFEDDEYYYYVKAVPKMRVTAPKKTLETIRDEEDEEEPEEAEDTFSEDDLFIHRVFSDEEEEA